MEPITLATLAALAGKIVSFIKYLVARDWNAVATQAAVWIAGIVVVLLAAQSEIADITIGDQALSALDFASQVLVGLGLGSAFSFAYDVKSAVDNTDSAAEPPLTGTNTTPGT